MLCPDGGAVFQDTGGSSHLPEIQFQIAVKTLFSIVSNHFGNCGCSATVSLRITAPLDVNTPSSAEVTSVALKTLMFPVVPPLPHWRRSSSSLAPSLTRSHTESKWGLYKKRMGNSRGERVVLVVCRLLLDSSDGKTDASPSEDLD